MLVVIAIIAILVSILIPTVLGATKKAKAATDAANLRAVLSVLDIVILDGSKENAEAAAEAMAYECKSFKNADCYAVFVEEGMYVDVYYVNGQDAYGIDYFSEVASSGSSSINKTLEQLINEFGEGNVIKLEQQAD